jgi:hypothetical protein
MDEFERLVSEPQFSEPKRHHYVSVFYLSGFTDDGHLQVFDRKTGEIRRQSPKDTTVRGNFYTFIDKNDQKRFDLEKLFSIIEGRASSALKTIENGESPSHEEREHLALFIAMTAIRTPAALEEARHVKQEVLRAEMRLRMTTQQQAYLQVKESQPFGTTEEDLQKLATDVFETVNENRFTVEASDELARKASLKLWTPVAQTIFDRDWTVVEAPGDAEYLTSDSPAVLAPLERFKDEPTGFASLHAHLLFPLSKKFALVMNGDGGRFRNRKASAAQV